MAQFEPKIKLFSASAGTGKTYTLVQELNRILSTGVASSKVAAITFTRAATRDLRSKVKDLDELNINTIHGFFAGILREQSVYFRQSADFKILDDFDEQALFEEAAAEVMLKKCPLAEYETLFADYDFENVINMLQKLEKHYSTVRDHIETDPKKLLEQEKQAEHAKFEELVLLYCNETIIDNILNIKCDIDDDKLELLRRQVVPLISKIAPLLKQTDHCYKVAPLIKGMEKYSVGSRGSKKYWSEADMEQLKFALRSFRMFYDEINKYKLGELWIIKEAAKNRKLLFDLFKEVHAGFDVKKKQLDVISYNDIEINTYDLVTKHPKVAEYYRDKYDHILVDEFQDTNRMQKDILFEIAKELFLVGDAKQSIYRFRNADVSVFIEAQNKCKQGELKTLTKSMRSLKNIITMVNSAFPQIFGMTHSKERRTFEAEHLAFDDESGREDTDAPGVVRFINAPSPNAHFKSFNHKLEAQIALDLIEKGVAEGKSYQDFAMLFRAANHMREFEKLFREHGIPFIVYGGESRNDLYGSLKSLFSIILNPYNDYAMLEVLKLPSFYMSDEEIYRIKQGRSSIWEGLTNEPVKKFILDMRISKDHGSFTEFVSDVLRRSRFIPSASLMFAGQDVGAEQAVLSAAAHVENEGEGIDYFMEYIYKMKSENEGAEVNAVKLMTIHASKGLQFKSVIMPCLDHVPPPLKDSVVISDIGDIAVKLGDEESNTKFNTVLYYNIKDYEQEADIAESKRLFYVAATRARDELYLISDFTKKGSNINGKRWVDWTSSIFREQIVDYEFSSKRTAPLPKRKVVRTGPAACTLVETQPPILRRCSVSYIRDLARGSYDHSQTEGSRDARIREGNIIHSILENWNDGDAVDRIYGDMGKDAAAHLIPVIDSFVTSELGKKLLSAKEYLSEHSFAFKEGAMIISGRIDRINIYDDHVWVVDYKRSTNEKELEGYKAQLACYLKFAERAFPGKKVTGSIIDITECREYAFGSNDLAITV